MTKTLNEFTDAELAGMVRGSIYAMNARFGDEPTDCRFLLVMAVPYGQDEGVDDLPTSIEAFQSFLSDDDWKEREFQVYDHRAAEHFFSASMEEVEGNRDEEE